MGRPSLYSAEKAKQILRSIREGVWFEDACLDAGVAKSTVQSWAKRGDEEGSGDLFAFACDLRRARREANAPHLVNIHAAEEKDWKAAAWYLERKERKRFGPQLKVEVESVFSRVLDALAEGLTADEFQRASAIIAEALSEDGEA
jgi:hypothetical protein